jgi:galactokinase/mevalonate kinase-like predicted kinase
MPDLEIQPRQGRKAGGEDIDDVATLGAAMRQAFEAQIAMFPHMMNGDVQELIDQYHDRALGWKLSGAGGGGYLILVADSSIEHSIRVVVRREIV